MPGPSKVQKPALEGPPEVRWMKWYPDEQLALPHENLDLYAPGGFHPVDIGDTFSDGRYTIHHKLGYGGFSTVWLARDSSEGRWVSLKIKQADESSSELLDDPEIKALNILEQRYMASPQTGRRYFPALLDSFHHVGPNGTHNCIVTEILGPSLDRIHVIYNNIDIQETLLPDTILRASRQLLEAVESFHEAGLVHGDISMGNFCFTCCYALGSDEDLWRELGGKPVTVPYGGEEPRPAHLPKYLVRAAEWAAWVDSPWEDICLVDWGESFPINETRSSIRQPWNMRAPEGFFLQSYDRYLDIWRAGCVISALFYQLSPFDSYSGGPRYINSLVQTMGPLPLSWDKKWDEMLDGKRPEVHPDSDWKPLAETFEPRRQKIIENTEKNEHYERAEYTEDDYQALRCLLSVMKGLLRHEPEKRMSAQEALAGIQWIDHWREERSDDEDEGSGGSFRDNEEGKSGEVEATSCETTATVDTKQP